MASSRRARYAAWERRSWRRRRCERLLDGFGRIRVFLFLLEEALLVLGIGTLRGMEGVGKEKGVKVLKSSY